MQIPAIVIDEFGGPERLRSGEVALPTLGDGDVRVAVRHAAVNPVDLKTRAGLTLAAAQARFPMVLGWDAAGVVEEAGAAAGFQPGATVAVMTPQVVDQRGTYAAQIVVPAANVAAAPAQLDSAIAAAVPLAGLTAAQGLDMLALAPGESVVINGAVGGLGRFALQLAAQAGARVVAVVGAGDAELARRLGAADVVDRDGDVAAQLAHVGDGARVDAALDLVGGAAAHALLAAVRDGGRYVTAVPKGVDPAGAFAEQRGIRPRTVYVRADAARLGELLAQAAAGTLVVPIAERLPAAEAAEAHRVVGAGGLRGKLLLGF